MAEMVEAYITKNPYYRPERKIKVRGLMLHSIGVGQPDPWVLQRNYNKADCYSASVHGFIGADETLITLPIFDVPGEAVQAFHCALSGNSTHIGVEMCEPGEIQYTGGANFLVRDVAKAIAYVQKVTRNAVELFAQLCVFHNLSPEIDICSHAEGYEMGIASGHADPEHLWRGLGMDYNMNKFRNDVFERMEESDLKRYQRLSDITNKEFHSVIETLMNARIINGDGSDKDGNEDIIDLSHDMVRTLVMEYRGGAFDRKLMDMGMKPAVSI